MTDMPTGFYILSRKTMWLIPAITPPPSDVEVDARELLAVLDEITPEAFAGALESLAETEAPR